MEGGELSRFLLDTNVWIHSVQQPDRLNVGVRKQLSDNRNELYLSPVSIWEAHHLARRRKLRLRGTFQEWLAEVFRRGPFREAPYNFAVGIEATRLQLRQPDFGDVLIGATAVVFDLTLLTTDGQLLEHPSIKTLRAD
jgi:PIN domain nuclease of toxin-antitoxin system